MRILATSFSICAKRVICTALAMGALVMTPLAAQGLSGRRAPSFSLPDSALTQHDILDYRGRWLLIEFMMTNCPHCKALSKTLEMFKTDHAANVAILSIVVPPDNLQTVGAYIKENKITFPILFDSSQVAASYFKATPANPSFDTPHLFAVDPKGMIVHDWGQASAEDPGLLKELGDLVAPKKP
jgi:peroxiredoxin